MPRLSSKTTKPVRKASRKPAAPDASYEEWLAESLRDPDEAAAYLDAVFAEGDQAAIMLAIRQVAKARGGVSAIAGKAKLTREATYRMLSQTGNPELRSLSAILGASGLRLTVRAIEKKAA